MSEPLDYSAEIMQALRRSVAETHTEMDLALSMRALFGWTSEPLTSLSTLCHMLNSDHRRHFPVSALPLVVQVTRRSDVIDVLSHALYEVRLRGNGVLDRNPITQT